MALFKPVGTEAVQNEPVIGQHYLECGSEGCEKNCQFYCNLCHRPLCEQCREEHQKSPETKNHEVVSYRQRKRQLPEEKCKVHQNKDIDIICEDCQVPLCSKCAMQDHRKHALNDLETIYSEGYTLCLEEIYKIHQYYLPTSQDIQNDVLKDGKEIKATMDKIRTSIKAEAEILKSLVDTVTSDEIEQINQMEKALMEELQSQDNTYKDHISYLEDRVKEFHGYLSKLQNNPIIFSLDDHPIIQPIPYTIKPALPVFTAGQYSKNDVTKLLGRVTVHNTKPKNREIKPMEKASSQLKPTEKQRKQDGEKSDTKQTPFLSSSVTKVREYKVPGVGSVCHISLGKSGRLWGSDESGNLVGTDLQGHLLTRKMKIGGGYGYHTVTQDGDLIFQSKKKKVNYTSRITVDYRVTDFFETGDWVPISIHSSHINGDILVGMIKDEEAKVTRYNKTGKEIQNIQRDNKGRNLYEYPHYLTENINGDICTSDYTKQAVVMVNKSGQHRLFYTGRGLGFYPWGICTDLHGHILVCNSTAFAFFIEVDRDTVYLLDQDGQFLSLLLTPQQGVKCPRGLCVDEENNLHLGQRDTNTVTVYKYLQ